jgi:hypothetical protein
VTGSEVLDVLEGEGWVRLGQTVRRGPVWLRVAGDGSTIVGVGGTEWEAVVAIQVARSLALTVGP